MVSDTSLDTSVSTSAMGLLPYLAAVCTDSRSAAEPDDKKVGSVKYKIRPERIELKIKLYYNMMENIAIKVMNLIAHFSP